MAIFWPSLSRKTTGHSYPWPVMTALALGVVVPTACIIWFMTEAMNNERLAVQQKLVKLHRSQLSLVQQHLQLYWQAKIDTLDNIDNSLSSAEQFAYIAGNDIASSVLIYNRSGELLYPEVISSEDNAVLSPHWSAAQQLEFTQQDYSAAADLYANIAAATDDVTIIGRALLARARCLIKLGDAASARNILSNDLAAGRFKHARDFQGRLIQPNAQLLALQIDSDNPSGEHDTDSIFAQLKQTVMNYDDSILPTEQRLFLMRELDKIAREEINFPTFSATSLALQYLQTKSAPTAGNQQLIPAQLDNVWQLASADGNILALFTLGYINEHARSLVQSLQFDREVSINLLPPFSDIAQSDQLVTLTLTGMMNGWQLALDMQRQPAINAAAEEQIAAYLWTGILIVVTIFLLSLISAYYVGKQLKLNNLKNNLVATVSHELKTPLASVRVLVDNLLEGGRDANERQEYLQLIAKENTRLSHLIENFLTFSRIQNNKQSFVFNRIDLRDVIANALDLSRDKFTAAGWDLELDLASDPLPIYGDANFLTTVLINLLDNAFKYSGEMKHVIVHSYRRDNQVCVAVQDYGIGLSRRHSRKIFDRFYRVNQQLTQNVDGCGLGLNIVDYVVKEHHGFIQVESRLDKGSTFTVCLPHADSTVSKKLALKRNYT